MPTYEYRCPEGHEFEHFFRSIREGTSEFICPTCGKTAQRKVSGGAGLVFKGSGFYITDYGKDGKKDLRRGGGSQEGSGGSDKSASGSETGGSSSSESKPSGDKKKSPGSGSSE